MPQGSDSKQQSNLLCFQGGFYMKSEKLKTVKMHVHIRETSGQNTNTPENKKN